MDTSFLPFVPNFSATHSVLIHKPLSEVFEKLGTASAHSDVCRLSSLCTAIDIQGQDSVALTSGETVQRSHFLHAPSLPADEINATTSKAFRQHFTLEETIPVFFGLAKSKVAIRGTLTWTVPDSEVLASAGPVYAVYESEVVGGLPIRIYRLRKMETVEGGTTRVTEYLYGVGPPYLKFVIAKEAVTKHGAHVARYPELFES